MEYNDILFIDWLREWLGLFCASHLKLSTYQAYDDYIEKHISPHLGSISLKSLDTATLQRFYNAKLKNGKLNHSGGLSPKTIHNIHVMIHQALQQACNISLVEKNASNYVTLPKIPKHDIQVFSIEEESKLIAVAKTEPLGIGIIICLATGIRLGEMLALKWSDYDAKNGTIQIKRTYNRLRNYDKTENKNKTITVFDTPKTKKSYRVLPLSEPIKKALKNEKNKTVGFIVSINEKPVEPRTYQDYYARIIKKAEIRYANFHTLRHTFATRALEHGVPAKVVSEILGHSSITITMDLYSHVLMDEKRTAMKKMEHLFLD